MAQFDLTPGDFSGEGDADLTPSALILWFILIITLVAFLGIFTIIFAGGNLGIVTSVNPFDPRLIQKQSALKHPQPNILHIAGSGTCVEIIRQIVRAYRQSAPEVMVRVHDSIGSLGAIRALQTGDIDIGLISRRPTLKEKRLPIQVIPFARIPVVIAVNAKVPKSNMTEAELTAIYSGKKRKWENGAPIILLLRELGDSSQEAINKAITGFERLHLSLYQEKRWRTVFKDQHLIQALVKTPDSIGITDLGMVKLSKSKSIRVLRYEGMIPDLQNGTYPFIKTLSFIISKGKLTSQMHRFLLYIKTESARQLLQLAGYYPIPFDLPEQP